MDAYESIFGRCGATSYPGLILMNETIMPGLKDALRVMASSPAEKLIRSMRGYPIGSGTLYPTMLAACGRGPGAFDGFASLIKKDLARTSRSEANQRRRARFRVIDGGVTSWKPPRTV